MLNGTNRDRKDSMPEPAAKDTLIIIGNGFDVWQGLHTRYAEFQAYYLEHRSRILKKLHIREHVFRQEDGQMVRVSDVELIYGDPFDPRELEDQFWSTFEASLEQIDAERINLFFGKGNGDLRRLKISLRNANRILQEAFCGWISGITTEEKDTDYRFGDNCLFINFNYTDTLQKRFQVSESDEIHIHGEASDKKSIIFGHAAHPQLPEPMLYRLGGRFRGLFLVEHILYQTDKHVRENIDLLAMFFAVHGVMPEKIKHVYVLGHSMGPADLEYFSFLISASGGHVPNGEDAGGGGAENPADPLEELHLRIQYAVQRFGYGTDEEEIDPAQREAMFRQLAQEQEQDAARLRSEFRKVFKWGKEGIVSGAPTQGAAPRTKEAMWHISCFSDRDRQWAQAIMEAFEYKNVQFYPTIDSCLEPFRQG